MEGYLTKKLKSTRLLCAILGFTFMAVTVSIGLDLSVEQYFTILSPLYLYITGESANVILKSVRNGGSNKKQ